MRRDFGIVVAMVLLSGGCAQPTPEPQLLPAASANEIVLRVTSATPGARVALSGAYILGESGKVQTFRTRTPFEARGRGNYGAALIATADGQSELHAELVYGTDPNTRMNATASGTQLLLQHNVGQRGPFATSR